MVRLKIGKEWLFGCSWPCCERILISLQLESAPNGWYRTLEKSLMLAIGWKPTNFSARPPTSGGWFFRANQGNALSCPSAHHQAGLRVYPSTTSPHCSTGSTNWPACYKRSGGVGGVSHPGGPGRLAECTERVSSKNEVRPWVYCRIRRGPLAALGRRRALPSNARYLKRTLGI